MNQIERHYNGLGQLTEEFQEHSGAVNTGTSPSVEYVFSEMVSSANHSRLVRTVYPNGRIVRSEYGTPGGLNDHISRLEYLADDASGGIGTHLEELSYLGLDTVVRRAHPEPDVDLTYIKLTGEPDGDAGDQYAGLDRFGRVIDQRWIDTGTLAETDRFGYGHDRNGDRLYRENLIDAAFSELYHEDGAAGEYDLLNRLTDFQRGTLSGAKDTISTASREQVWDLDALGNWDSLASDGGTAQTRTHNAQNQVTGVNGQTSPTFDNNGNTTTDETGKKFKFDAWNRLRDVRDASNSLLETLSYDALNRRIELAPQSGTARALYYSANWQVVEERESGMAVVQNVWSPVYVDALILRDRDTDGNGSLEERMYVQQDANFNVTAIINTAGVVQERFIYDPYGKASYLNANFTSRASSNFNWLYLHQGGRLDLTSALYNFRNRDLSATLGRWLQQDPMGYVDGVSLYQYVSSNSITLVDPSGNVGQPTVMPTMPVRPLPSSSVKCLVYKSCDSYALASAACFCQCAGDTQWSQFVRGCLRDLYDKGVSPSAAHSTCYDLADQQNFPGGRPVLTLAYCYVKCFAAWNPASDYPLGDYPSLPPDRA